MRTEQQVLRFSIHRICIFIKYFLNCYDENQIIYLCMYVQYRSLRYSIVLVSVSKCHMYVT